MQKYLPKKPNKNEDKSRNAVYKNPNRRTQVVKVQGDTADRGQLAYLYQTANGLEIKNSLRIIENKVASDKRLQGNVPRSLKMALSMSEHKSIKSTVISGESFAKGLKILPRKEFETGKYGPADKERPKRIFQHVC